MKVLIISGNNLPMSPAGAAYIAGSALQAGHEVAVFDCLTGGGNDAALFEALDRFEPDVVGLSISLVTCDIPEIRFGENRFGNRVGFTDIRPMLKHTVEIVKRRTDAVLIAGGTGFNYYPKDWLIHLDIDFGMTGESELSFPLFLKRLAEGDPVSDVPGIIIRSGDKVTATPGAMIAGLDETGMPAYQLFDVDHYNEHGIPWGVTTKRGCAFGCGYCSNSLFEGREYRLKSPDRVVAEIRHVIDVTGSSRINFCNNSFNCPIPHAKAICSAIMDAGLNIRWRAGNFKPLGISHAFCKLIRTSGCTFVGLAIETASDRLLANMNRGYRKADIRSALDHLTESGMDFGVSVLIGNPGETMTTIRETLSLVDAYPGIKAVWVNIGLFGLKRQLNPLAPLENDDTISDPSRLFKEAYYISPELDEEDMTDLIDTISLRKNYLIQINKPWPGYTP